MTTPKFKVGDVLIFRNGANETVTVREVRVDQYMISWDGQGDGTSVYAHETIHNVFKLHVPAKPRRCLNPA